MRVLLADGCKNLSSGSPLPMEFHSSSFRLLMGGSENPRIGSVE